MAIPPQKDKQDVLDLLTLIAVAHEAFGSDKFCISSDEMDILLENGAEYVQCVDESDSRHYIECRFKGFTFIRYFASNLSSSLH